MSMHEPRLKQGMGVGYAVSPPHRADHCHNMHNTAYTAPRPVLEELAALGILEPLPVNDLSAAKMRILVNYSRWMRCLNSAVCCYFVVMYGCFGFDRMTRLVRSVTGWNTSLFELMKTGERVMNLARIFNIREGFTADDDKLPKLFFQRHPNGPLQVAVQRQEFLDAKGMYYGMRGWNNGVPEVGKLAELGME